MQCDRRSHCGERQIAVGGCNGRKWDLFSIVREHQRHICSGNKRDLTRWEPARLSHACQIYRLSFNDRS